MLWLFTKYNLEEAVDQDKDNPLHLKHTSKASLVLISCLVGVLEKDSNQQEGYSRAERQSDSEERRRQGSLLVGEPLVADDNLTVNYERGSTRLQDCPQQDRPIRASGDRQHSEDGAEEL